MTATLDYYDLLGVPPTASPEEIKKAWRRECRRHHPDVAGHRDAEEFVRILNAAKATLLNVQSRAEYDAWRMSVLAPHAAPAEAAATAYATEHRGHVVHQPEAAAPGHAPGHAPAHTAPGTTPATSADPSITDDTGPRVFAAPQTKAPADVPPAGPAPQHECAVTGPEPGAATAAAGTTEPAADDFIPDLIEPPKSRWRRWRN